jgi:hypothetical protein
MSKIKGAGRGREGIHGITKFQTVVEVVGSSGSIHRRVQ